MNGEDSIGTSKLWGYLYLNGGRIHLILLKIYDNRKAVGQTGEWKNLVYEGSGTK